MTQATEPADANAPAPTITLLFGEAEIAARVGALAREISATMADGFTVLVVLKGAFVLAADLVRALDRCGSSPQIAFVTLSSYGADTVSSGIVTVVGDFPPDVTGRRVLVLDDIVDTGRTLAFAKAELLARGAAEVKVCTLLDKPSRREVDFAADFVGFEIDDHFVVGYGIDYDQRYRHLNYIGVVG